jgi:hypothetical protein
MDVFSSTLLCYIIEDGNSTNVYYYRDRFYCLRLFICLCFSGLSSTLFLNIYSSYFHILYINCGYLISIEYFI